MPSNWDKIIGQQRVKNTLQTAIRNQRLSHAYLFWGNVDYELRSAAYSLLVVDQ